jgi:hypothetical protein
LFDAVSEVRRQNGDKLPSGRVVYHTDGLTFTSEIVEASVGFEPAMGVLLVGPFWYGEVASEKRLTATDHRLF